MRGSLLAAQSRLPDRPVVTPAPPFARRVGAADNHLPVPTTDFDRCRPAEQPLGDRQVRPLHQSVAVRGLGREQHRSGHAGDRRPVSAARDQRRIAKKTWMPLLQRKVIAESLKSRHVKPAGLRLVVR